jgi:hypothetical protein
VDARQQVTHQNSEMDLRLLDGYPAHSTKLIHGSWSHAVISWGHDCWVYGASATAAADPGLIGPESFGLVSYNGR